MKNKRVITFFIPHYANHERLIFLLKLSDQVHIFPKKFIIYDSSPNPIGLETLLKVVKEDEIIYREFNYNTNGNTYAYVLRDFLLSEDSTNGAFILPHDEFLLIDYELFSANDPTVPFACGNQLAFCPSSSKIAEYRLAKLESIYTVSEQQPNDFNPQYHATFIPGSILSSLGGFVDQFLITFGSEYSTYIDFVLMNILKNIPICFSKNSIYLQERLMRRRSTGSYVHPSFFVKRINENGKKKLSSMLNTLWESIGELPKDHANNSVDTLLNIFWLQKTLLMVGADLHINLFKLSSDNSITIQYERVDIFCGYHIIGPGIKTNHLIPFFSEKSIIINEPCLPCMRAILNSY